MLLPLLSIFFPSWYHLNLAFICKKQHTCGVFCSLPVKPLSRACVFQDQLFCDTLLSLSVCVLVLAVYYLLQKSVFQNPAGHRVYSAQQRGKILWSCMGVWEICQPFLKVHLFFCFCFSLSVYSLFRVFLPLPSARLHFMASPAVVKHL